MFENCIQIPILTNWNVQSVVNVDGMFKNCTDFNQDLSRWKLRNVNGEFMFEGCPILDAHKPTFMRPITQFIPSNIMDAFTILGIEPQPNESKEEFKGRSRRAYHKLSLQYHPDKNNTSEAKHIMQRRNDAKPVIGFGGSRRTISRRYQKRKHSLKF